MHAAQRSARSDTAWLAGATLLAFMARLAWVLYADADPVDGRFDDSVFYHMVAAHLADGGGYTNPHTFLPTAQWPPGYVFFLTPLYRLFGDSFHVAEVANAVLGALTAGLLYLLTRRLFDQRAAIVAALLLAVFPGTVFLTSVIYAETLFTFVFVLAMLLLSIATKDGSTRWRWLLAFGLVAGAAAMVRETGLSLIAIAAIVWLVRAGWRPALRRMAVATAAAAVVVLPWTVRNAITMDAPLLLSTSTGLNLWMGHHAGAEGGAADTKAFVLEHGPYTRPGGEVEVNNAGLRAALRYAARHPADELVLAAKKVRILYSDDTPAFDLNEDYGQRTFMPSALRDTLQPLTNAFYFAVLVAAGLGIVRWFLDRSDGALLPVVAIGVVTIGHVASFADPRFHLPIVPLFCALAGYGLAGLPALFRRAQGA